VREKKIAEHAVELCLIWQYSWEEGQPHILAIKVRREDCVQKQEEVRETRYKPPQSTQ
jgi:hypothetical protein